MVLRKTNEAIVLPYCAFLFCWFSGIYERGKTQQHQSRQRQMYAGERLFQTCLVYRVKEDMKTRNDNVSQEEISIMTFWLIEINGFLQKYSVTSMAVFAIERIDGRGSRATVESYISKVIRIFFLFLFWKRFDRENSNCKQRIDSCIKSIRNYEKERVQPRVKKLHIPIVMKHHGDECFK